MGISADLGGKRDFDVPLRGRADLVVLRVLNTCLGQLLGSVSREVKTRLTYSLKRGRSGVRLAPLAAPAMQEGEAFGGDDIVAAAMIERLVQHAEVIALKGDSYRLKDLGRVSAAGTTEE